MTVATYKLFHSDHEYLGQVLLDLENAVGGDRVRKIFEKHGLTNIEAQAWYPAQKFLDSLIDMSSGSVPMMDFVSIGLKQVEMAIMPPEFASLPLIQILGSMDAAYHLNNRGTDIGEIKCDVVDDKHVKMIFRVPQPDDIWYGVSYGYMRRLAGGVRFTVTYDKETPRRDHGGEVTIIHIKWD